MRRFDATSLLQWDERYPEGSSGMEWLMKYLWVWLSLSLLFSPAARAQPANSSDSTDMIRALLARVEQLEKRVAELEGRPGVPAPAAQPVTAAAEPANRAPDT